MGAAKRGAFIAAMIPFKPRISQYAYQAPINPPWGYGGLLERVRFAVDPQENFFYFGPSA